MYSRREGQAPFCTGHQGLPPNPLHSDSIQIMPFSLLVEEGETLQPV